jgi:hypothetical protein
MKKILIIFFVIALPLFAQSTKGQISLIYNEEKFDLSITQIVIRKENSVLISIRAEKNDSLGQQSISMEFPLESMAIEPKVTTSDALRLLISSQRSNDHNGKRFTFNYGPGDVVVEMYYGNERVNWSSPNFQFKFDKVKITNSPEGIKINGSFSGKYNSAQQGNPLKTVAEIKDGKFEIIL